MYPTLFDLAIFGYIAATGLSLAYLVQREEWLHRLAAVAAIAGWGLHAVSLLAPALPLGPPPPRSPSEGRSGAVWGVGLWGLWGERPEGGRVLCALRLGVLWAGRAWGSVFAYDPLALLSFVAWVIYAGTLAGRAAAGWRGRRAAYFAIIGFATLVLTLGAGLFLPGRHGS